MDRPEGDSTLVTRHESSLYSLFHLTILPSARFIAFPFHPHYNRFNAKFECFHMIKDAIAKLAERADLSEKEAEEALLDIMCGSASPVQIAAYLMGLRVKGETVEEIAGSARAMRARASRIRVTDPLVMDTCGTGGDRSGTFNISTAAAFVAAGSGVTVAKHGNRSVSSRCGSADILCALGVNIDLPAARVEECVNDVGIGFLFAPLFHGAM